MILRARSFPGHLDISAPEQLDSTGYEWLAAAAPFRRTMKSGDILSVPDEYYRFPNITNAVEAGLLEIISFDKRKEQIVIHAEVTGSTGIPGTKYNMFDIHGGQDTAIVDDINGVPSLVFENGCDHRTKWTMTISEDYQSGSPIYVEAFWSCPGGTPANVRWYLEYKCIQSGADTTDPTGSVSYIQAASLPDKLYTTSTNLVIPPADLAAGRLLMVAVYRTATNPADTLDSPVYVHVVRLSYTGQIFSEA